MESHAESQPDGLRPIHLAKQQRQLALTPMRGRAHQRQTYTYVARDTAMFGAT